MNYYATTTTIRHYTFKTIRNNREHNVIIQSDIYLYKCFLVYEYNEPASTRDCTSCFTPFLIYNADLSAINELKGNVTFGIENAERCRICRHNEKPTWKIYESNCPR